MGYIIYGAGAEYEIEDRTLAHVKVAVGLKLRQGESFYVSWVNPVEKGSGRLSLWVSPNIPLIFRFSGSRTPELNAVWLNVLLETSNAPRGMVLIPEQDAMAYAAKHNITDELLVRSAQSAPQPQSAAQAQAKAEDQAQEATQAHEAAHKQKVAPAPEAAQTK